MKNKNLLKIAVVCFSIAVALGAICVSVYAWRLDPLLSMAFAIGAVAAAMCVLGFLSTTKS